MIKLAKEVKQYFPYDNVRPYQDEFISTIYEAVRNNQSALVEGSNGLGKTVASLSACLPTALEKKPKDTLRCPNASSTRSRHGRT